MAPRKRREKSEVENVPTKTLLKSIRKDLHTMVLQAEAALAKPKKRKR